MRITIETTNLTELEKIIQLFQRLQLKDVQITTELTTLQPKITKGDKSLNPRALFGVWENEPREISEIRSNNWKRNWSL